MPQSSEAEAARPSRVMSGGAEGRKDVDWAPQRPLPPHTPANVRTAPGTAAEMTVIEAGRLSLPPPALSTLRPVPRTFPW